VLIVTWNFFKWIPPQHSFLLHSSRVKLFIAILHLVWIFVLLQMVFLAFGNCELLSKALVLLQCAGLSPIVFPFGVLSLFLSVLGVHFGCIIILQIKCFSAPTLMIFYFRLPMDHLHGGFMHIILCLMIANSFVAGTFVGIIILWDRNARKMYLSQAVLIDSLLEQEFAGIMRSENLISNDLRYNPGKELHKWEQLCPCSTPFDYKMPKLSLVDSPAQPDHALVHWMQVAVGTLMYILNSRPDLTHSVHQVARYVHNPGPAHVKALDHILRYLAGTGYLC
jgi:hypothetical protein